MSMSNSLHIDLKKDSVLCHEDEHDNSLYIVESGSLLVCLRKGTQIIPIAYLGKGEFVGELSFFDNEDRSANIIALEDCKLTKIPQAQLTEKFPSWLITTAKFMAKKIRLYNEVIKTKGIKRTKVDSIKPLSIDEQRHYLALLKK